MANLFPVFTSETASGQELERHDNVDEAPLFIDGIAEDKGRKDPEVFQESQVSQVAKRVAEIERDPLQPGIDGADDRGDFSESPRDVGPDEHFPHRFAAQRRVDDPVWRYACTRL